MQRPLKILYCTDQLYKHGGIERVTTTKLNGWVEYTDNTIHLVTSEQKNKSFCYGLDSRIKLHDLGINYSRDITYFSITNIKKTFLYIYRYRELIRLIKPDIIVCINCGPGNVFMPYFSKKCITIKEYHASGINKYKLSNSKKTSFFKSLIYRLFKLSEKMFRCSIVLNETEKKYCHGSNVRVIPNPILIPEYKEKFRENIVVAAGRIAPVKGYDLLIKAWRQVNAVHPEWKLQIYGDGDNELKKELKKQIESLGLSNSITFCGVTSNLNHVFFTSSIHVLSSLEESFGMVILEAQACGLPSVAFNCPTGPGKLIQDNVNGVLVNPQDVIALSNSLILLIESTGLRYNMGVNARKSVKKYDLSSIIKIWNSLFESLLITK